MIAEGLRTSLAAALIALAPAVARAHPGHTHSVMGTIKTVDAAHIVVEATNDKTREAAPVDVGLTAATKYRRGDKSIERSALRVGERVVVSYTETKNALTATDVRVGGK